MDTMNSKDWTDRLKDRMESYMETPSDTAWTEVSERIASEKKTAFPTWMRVVTGIAAALAAVTVMTIGFTGNPEDSRLAEDISQVPADNMPCDIPGSQDICEPQEAVEASEDHSDRLAEAISHMRLMAENSSTTDIHPKSAATEHQVCHEDSHATDASEVASKAASEAARTSSQTTAAALIAAKKSSQTATLEAETESTSEVSSEDASETVSDSTGDTISDATGDTISEIVSDTMKEADNAAWAGILSEDKASRRSGRTSMGLSASGSGRSGSSEFKGMQFATGSNPISYDAPADSWVSPDFDNGTPVISLGHPTANTEYNHRIPVRLGLSVRYDLWNGLGAESGLTYSILRSDILTGEKESGKDRIEGTQTLHYVGVPLNITYSFFNNRYFTAYLSGGGMVEKCVKGRLENVEHYAVGQVRTTTSSMTPKELQWSLNASAGIQVNVLDRLGIYAEPGISHRLRSGSSVRSAYTDKPTDFTISFGLRFSFKKLF